MTAITVPYRVVDSTGSCRSVLATVTVDTSGRMSTPVSWLDGVTASTTAPSIPSGGSLEPGECCTVPGRAYGNVGAPGVVAQRMLSGSMVAGYGSYSTVVTVPIVNTSGTQPMLVVLHGRILAEDIGATSQTAAWRAHGEIDPGTGTYVETGTADKTTLITRVATPWSKTLTVPAATTVTLSLRARPNLMGPRDFIADANARAAITLDTWVGVYA